MGAAIALYSEGFYYLRTKKLYKYAEGTATLKSKLCEVGIGFAQVYEAMGILSFTITAPATFHVFFFLLEHTNPDNQFKSDGKLFAAYLKRLKESGMGATSRQTFQNAIKDLLRADVIYQAPNKNNRGEYFFNPHVVWKGSADDRENYLKTENNKLTFNPIKHD